MAVFDIFSSRGKPVPDVFQYDKLPDVLRGQLVHVLKDCVDHVLDWSQVICEHVHNIVLREWGRQELNSQRTVDDELFQHVFDGRTPIVEALTVVELIFRAGPLIYKYSGENATRHEELVSELNHRFRAAGVGFEFVGDQIIRVDSTIAHEEIVKPALSLLTESRFSAANDEYRKAHEHYRHGRYDACLVECCKCFESVMKVICRQKGYPYQETDTASKLIASLESNGLFPAHMAAQLNHLAGLLRSTVPTVRNKLGGHGAGHQPVKVGEEIAAFALHSTAADVLFLAKLAK